MSQHIRTALSKWCSEHTTQFATEADETAILQYADSSLADILGNDSPDLSIASELLCTTSDPKLVAASIAYASLKNRRIDQWPQHGIDTDILDLCQGVKKLDIPVILQENNAAVVEQSTKMRQMLLAMVDDIRVVVIKLAEQIALVRDFHHHPVAQEISQPIAKSALHIYANLANRLGLGQMKWRLEDLSFRFLEPDTYKTISSTFQQKRQERETYVKTFSSQLGQLLKEEAQVTTAEIKGRAKHIYSIYKKSIRKRHRFSEVNDATAVRIILPTVSDCYAALSLVHSTWSHIPEEFDDYISHPKPNGYRSLHTVINGPENQLVEIQIRTIDMHEEAELGLAAHWKYKEGRSAVEKNALSKVNWLSVLLGWQEEMDTNKEKERFRSVFSSRVYVFTPQNKILDLPLKSTPLDFAYLVHTEVGNRCVGAKVNGKIVPLTYQLETGDQVNIITQKNSTPSQDWLNPKEGYIVTKQARSKIKHHFKQINYDDNVKQGSDIWEKHTSEYELKKDDMKKLVGHFNFQTFPDMLAALGAGDLTMRPVIYKIRSILSLEPIAQIQKARQANDNQVGQNRSVITIEGVTNIMVQIAKCCHPIPGDDICGYITKLHGISVHRSSCENLHRLKSIRPERISQAQWGLKEKSRFKARIHILAEDEAGAEKQITQALFASDCLVLSHESVLLRNRANRRYRYQIEVGDKIQLDKLLSQLQQIPAVSLAERE